MTSEEFFSQHQRLTRSLKKWVQDYEKSLDPDVFEAFLESLSEQIVLIKTDLFQIPSGPLRAQHLHKLVDAEIAEGSHIAVSCKKGCSACCHMEVEITTDETEVLMDLLRQGHQIDRARLQKQSTYALQDPQWRQGVHLDNRCVFLNDEGSCSVYESRPMMCRRHSVTSPAVNCSDINAAIVLRYFPKVDLLISAANEDESLQIGPLAKMLEMKLLRG